MDEGVGAAPGNDGGTIDVNSNDEAVEGVGSWREDLSTDLELKACNFCQ